jgi:hypothetical protein
MEEQKARPPFVRFKLVPIENRAASEEAGHYVADDIHFAFITPVGSKDTVEHRVEDWFKNLQEAVNQERFPNEWFQAYKRAYADWCEGHETPETGTPITDWAKPSPAQVLIMQAIGVRTVEDMAEANDETVTRIGMGGRALKQAAIAWLDSADHGKISGELESLRQRNSELEARDNEREAEFKTLKATVAALEKASKKEPA